MWQIIDDNGVIHSGEEDDMKLAFDAMRFSIDEMKKIYGFKTKVCEDLCDMYPAQWSGDLKLVEVKKITR